MTDRELMQMALNALESECVHDRFYAIKTLSDRLAQPERKWVGLTDEEIAEIPFLELVEGIQAKLKEKNT